MIKPRLSTWIIAFCTLISPAFPAADWDAPHQGNPIVPGYFADPSVIQYQGKGQSDVRRRMGLFYCFPKNESMT